MNAHASLLATTTDTASSLTSYRGVHKGEMIIVCGCGDSLNELLLPVGCVAIGVNDVGRRFPSDNIVVARFIDGRQ